MLIRMHTVSRQGMSLLSSVPACIIRIHEYAHILHTHTCGHRRTSTHTIIHSSKHIYTNAHKHVSTPTHIPAHKHSCSHIRGYYLHTCARALKHTRAYKTKNAFTDTTHNTHTHTDTLIR